jgi:3-hydroxyacyl-[acyl-carrier-protein] dehydratase
MVALNAQHIINKLPYKAPFLFVDDLVHIDENGVTGTFTFNENLEFYKGHFIDNPVTPGVILTEVMAQIGVVCLGIYLLNESESTSTAIALTSTDIEFLKPVFPGEKVTVTSQKMYFRFGKLKCKVSMKNDTGQTVCTGTIAGMITAS